MFKIYALSLFGTMQVQPLVEYQYIKRALFHKLIDFKVQGYKFRQTDNSLVVAGQSAVDQLVSLLWYRWILLFYFCILKLKCNSFVQLLQKGQLYVSSCHKLPCIFPITRSKLKRYIYRRTFRRNNKCLCLHTLQSNSNTKRQKSAKGLLLK